MQSKHCFPNFHSWVSLFFFFLALLAKLCHIFVMELNLLVMTRIMPGSPEHPGQCSYNVHAVRCLCCAVLGSDTSTESFTLILRSSLSPLSSPRGLPWSQGSFSTLSSHWFLLCLSCVAISRASGVESCNT